MKIFNSAIVWRASLLSLVLLILANQLPAQSAKQPTKGVAGAQPAAQPAPAPKAGANRVGTALSIKFTDVKGKPVDLDKLRGKVVLIDFWATWCGPCVEEVPNVRATFQKLNPRGFEIIGISFDESKESLTQFIGQQRMTWPQYFNGQGWDNGFGKQYGIRSIPSMWLVDKKGVLRDVSARSNLEQKVMALLAEK